MVKMTKNVFVYKCVSPIWSHWMEKMTKMFFNKLYQSIYVPISQYISQVCSNLSPNMNLFVPKWFSDHFLMKLKFQYGCQNKMADSGWPLTKIWVHMWPISQILPNLLPIWWKNLVFSGVLGENALLILKFAYPSWSAGLLSRLKLIKQFLEQFSLFWHKFLEHKVQFFLNFTLSLGRSWSKDSTLWFSGCPDHKLTLF